MATNWVGQWLGGRIAEGRDGRKSYYLERMHEGDRVAFSLGNDEEKAKAELALFLRDPAAWIRERKRLPDGVMKVAPDRVLAFGAHLKAKGRSKAYRLDVHTYLCAWQDAIGSRDLRRVTLADLHAALDAAKTARKHRIIVLKSFCAWLRETGVLERNDDPTLDLKVPPARPERAVRAKGYSMEHVAAIYAHVEAQDVRDALRVACFTGMHGTELGRIIKGEAVIREVNDPCGIAATVRFDHKSGRVHVQSIDALTLAAIRRLVARGKAYDKKRQHRQIDEAAERLNAERRKRKMQPVEGINPGELRHSFVSWRSHARLVTPSGGGVGLSDVAEAIGHQSVRTTQRFYDNLAVPPMVVIPLVLAHPDDPLSPPAAARKRSRAGPAT